MAAITWRNVDAPSLGDPSRSLLAAQQGIQGAFTTLGDVLKGYQDNQAKNWDITKANNTEDFYAKASSLFPNAEAFKAALASGQLNEMAKAHGAQIDQAGVRQFMDTRPAELQRRGLAENQYNDAQLELRLRPLMQQAEVLAAKGQTKELDAFMGANPELARFRGGKLVAAGIIGERDAARYGWDAQRAARDEAKAPVELERLRAETAAIPVNAESSRMQARAALGQVRVGERNATTHEQQLALQSEEKIRDRLATMDTARAALIAPITSPAGHSLVLAEIAKMPKEKQGMLLEAYGQVTADKDFAGVRATEMVQALSESIDNHVWFFDRTGKGVKSALKDIINSPATAKQRELNQARHDEIAGEAQILRNSLKGAMPPVAPPPQPGAAGTNAAGLPLPTATASPAAEKLAAAGTVPSKAVDVIPPPPAKTYKPDGITTKPNPARVAWEEKYTQAAYDKQEADKAKADSKAEDDALAAIKANYRQAGRAEKKTLK